jgi:hypothetical protein
VKSTRTAVRIKICFVAALLAVTAAAGAAWSTDDSTVIHGCVSARGNLRVVTAADQCTDRETALTWNQQGPQGPAGADGANGVDGTATFAGWGCGPGLFVTGFTLAGKPRCGYQTAIYDADGDRYSAAGPDAADCDDSDPARNPATTEIGGNGVDENCDGQDGPAPPDPADCDDGDPYTSDVVTDGVCHHVAEFYDMDGDGSHAHQATGGSPDCDDTNDAVHPDAVEVINEVDDDCDGFIDEAA